ncbi:hypothetical protein [Nannocystis bainbridge]|uniref:Uncharacterized protein n=1 Tax=Nannocystis bainbridge TaxID=2995303 RepID=A0ABT5DSH2_9BACT|nr:hypothetical protein [Nannocystis bainbridge]MDC0716580.1 hypothetical protein [Nannocystis bainbridge]
MARARQRAEFARVVQILGPVAWRGDEGSIAAWVERLRGLADDEGPQIARSLLRLYRHGRLSPNRWAELTGAPPQVAGEIDDAIRRLWDAFAAAGLVPLHHTEENLGRVSPGLVKRWAWQPRWSLMSQDEDLLLMLDALVPTLLAVAAEPRVPKRLYMFRIVGHHARDAACNAVYRGVQIEETLRRAATWAPQARAVGAPELATYLERLGRHADAGPVDHEGAEQRLLDLASCSEPPRGELELVAVEGGWEGRHVRATLPGRTRIDGATGRMTTIIEKKKPRRR